MNTLELLKQRLHDEIAERQKMLGFISGLSEKLSDLNLPASICNNSLDFDYLKHADVIKVIRAIGGKFEKKPNVSNPSCIDYERQIGDFKVRCYQGEPPPNCKLVEVDEIIPAQPERIVKRKKLVCTDAPPAPELPGPAARKLILDEA